MAADLRGGRGGDGSSGYCPGGRTGGDEPFFDRDTPGGALLAKGLSPWPDAFYRFTVGAGVTKRNRAG